jgi:peptide/nickel transport system substrate-binding protein
MRVVSRAAVAAVLALGGADAGLSPAGAQTLSMAVSAAPTSVDPHYHTFTPNNSLASHIFSPLIDMDATQHPIPALAESWKLVDERTWEIKLRPGIKFHNGQALTPEDVAFTIDRVPKVANSPGSFSIYTKAITNVQIVDATTLRLTTAGVYPMLPIDLTQIYIIPKSLGPNPTTEDFNSGKNAIGTGPFKLQSYRSGEKAELVRDDAYWGPKPIWQRVTYRMVPNDGARTAALLSGDVALIEAVPTTDAARLRTDKRVTLAETNSLRIVYIFLDRSREGATPFVFGPNGETLDKNPLNDLRVRQALSIGINRQAIVDRVMESAAIPQGQLLPPGAYSYVPDLPSPAYDPERAKKLLADAGFPKGLRMTLHGPNDRYVNDGKIIQAVGQMWSRIGVQTQVEAITWSNYVTHASRLEYSAFLVGWGSSSGEASNPLRALLSTYDPAKGRGTTNRGRYSNPQLDAMVEQAMGTADDGARERLLQQATRIAMEDVGFIPLHTQKNIWAMKPGLAYTARADEGTRAADLRPVK